MEHLAVCLMIRGERTGIVISGKSSCELAQWADTFKNRIGYCGGNGESFQTAIKRAGMMERNERGAWGPLDLDCSKEKTQ